MLLYIELIVYGNCVQTLFGRLRLFRSSDLEENPGPRPSRRSCLVVYANTRGLHKNLTDWSIIARDEDVLYFCSETLVSSKLMIPGFGRPMQLLRGEFDRFRGLAVYVRDGSLAYGRRSYEFECCKVIVVRICSSSHNFYVLGAYRNPDLTDKIFDCLLTEIAKV